MPTRTASHTLPYTCEQLFDLAADVERYPEYLPGWVAVRIIERSANWLRVEQQLGLRLLRQPFVSTAELERPRRVLVRSHDSPFRSLHLEWRFEPAASGSCRVSLNLDFHLQSSFLEQIASALFEQTAAGIIARFERRAQQLYGTSAE